jgi:hypothetical protein
MKGKTQTRHAIGRNLRAAANKQAAHALKLVSGLRQFEVTRISKNYFPWLG